MIGDWDIRYLRLAQQVSTWSKDPSTQTGAVIVRPDKTVASLGFNGFPRVMPDKLEYLANREEKYSRIIHCEMNAMLNVRERVEGYTLYTFPFACCDRCVVAMIQAGIRRFVFPELRESEAERWASSLEKTKRYLSECWIPATEVPWNRLTP